jgi:DNA replication protein DnaC
MDGLNAEDNRFAPADVAALGQFANLCRGNMRSLLLFQVISGRAERAAVIVTTNLPFSEWTTMFPNARLCKAMLDRLTDQAHIIETGTESYRFRRTLAKNKGAKT